MVQESSARDQITILILGTVQSEKQDFFSKLHSLSLLKVISKDERTILNIPAWPALVALVAFFVVRAMRSRHA
jgi:hypothetical protein